MNRELKEWTMHFLKHKDLAQRKIIKISEDEKNSLLNIETKDKKIKHHITDTLNDKILQLISNNEHKGVTCPNTEENFKFLTKNWKKLSEINNLSIIFVNLKNNDKWQINPKVHSMIADPDSIEQGLRAMFDTANGKIDAGPGKKKPKLFDEDVAEKDETEEDV